MEALFFILCCCKKKKNRRGKVLRRTTATKKCFFCDVISDDVISICPRLGYHRECLAEQLKMRPSVSIACSVSDCPKNQSGQGHTSSFAAKSRWRFSGKWRDTVTNLLAFFGLACWGVMLFGGNRSGGSGNQYNWIPVFLIYCLTLTNLSHLVAFGVKFDLSDIFAILCTAFGIFITYYDYIPHIVEFISGVTIVTTFLILWWTLRLFFSRCLKLCKCCFRMCRNGIREETYEQIE
jgi:hypothetical protein